MKFLTALIRHSRQPARGGDRTPVSLQAPAQRDPGAGAPLVDQRPFPFPEFASRQTDSALQQVDGGEGARKALPPDEKDEQEPEAVPLASSRAPEPESFIRDAGLEVPGRTPAAATPATPQRQPKTRDTPDSAPSPAPPPTPAAAAPAEVRSPTARPAEPWPESSAAAASGPRVPVHAAGARPAVPGGGAAAGATPAARASASDARQRAQGPASTQSAPLAEPASAPPAVTPADAVASPQAAPPTAGARALPGRLPERAAAGPAQRPSPQPRDWSPQPRPPEVPQVRIGQINVLVEDEAAATPRTRSSQPTPVRSNPFGRRGL